MGSGILRRFRRQVGRQRPHGHIALQRDVFRPVEAPAPNPLVDRLVDQVIARDQPRLGPGYVPAQTAPLGPFATKCGLGQNLQRQPAEAHRRMIRVHRIGAGEGIVAAVALGATVIEKHFTLDRTMEGPDHKASLEPSELTAMIALIPAIEKALGSAVKAPSASELEMLKLARRSVVAAKALKTGDVIAADALDTLRPAGGIEPKHFNSLIGRIVARDVPEGAALQWDDIAQGSI